MTTAQDIRLRDVKIAGDLNGTHKPGFHENGLDKGKKNVTSEEESGACSRLKESCTVCCIPCLASHNPLPENAGRFERFKHAFMLPPRGNLAFYIQFVVVMVQIWIVLYSLTHGAALPGGNFYSLLILFICCGIGGYVISFVNLPPLLGKNIKK